MGYKKGKPVGLVGVTELSEDQKKQLKEQQEVRNTRRNVPCWKSDSFYMLFELAREMCETLHSAFIKCKAKVKILPGFIILPKTTPPTCLI